MLIRICVRLFYESAKFSGVLTDETLLTAMGWDQSEKQEGANYTPLLGNSMHMANCFSVVAVVLACASPDASNDDSTAHVNYAGGNNQLSPKGKRAVIQNVDQVSPERVSNLESAFVKFCAASPTAHLQDAFTKYVSAATGAS